MKRIWMIVGFLLFTILMGYWFYPQYFKLPESLSKFISGIEEPRFDIHREIEILNNERDPPDKYSIKEYDWIVWRRQWEAQGGTLIKMDSWDEFKESLRQNEGFVHIFMLDEENRVIWYRLAATPIGPFSTFIVYLKY